MSQAQEQQAKQKKEEINSEIVKIKKFQTSIIWNFFFIFVS